ncbi:MAG: diguanylate cyclase [Gammaproteobacteria bacterium]|nr:diguanylate cyclase [Gammaproteobacteria bacterium]
MAMQDNDLAKKMEAMRLAYLSRLGAKVAVMQQSAKRLNQAQEEGEKALHLNALQQEAHKLAGSAGTFGLAQVGTAAHHLELFCQQVNASQLRPEGEDLETISRLLADLLKEAECKQESPPELAETLSQQSPPTPTEKSRKVLLVDDDEDLSSRLAHGLSGFGYQVKVINTPHAIEKTLDHFAPEVMILDLGFSSGASAGAEVVKDIRTRTDIECPIVILTAHNDFHSRLAAERAGCSVYLTKPYTLDNIISTLDQLTQNETTEPERILAIDDDPDILQFIQASLEMQGMVVETLLHPEQILETLDEFHPELILVDLMMPEVNGRELAAIIRQLSEYTSVPIVFLSAETSAVTKFDVLGIGADDYLTKPIRAEQLVTAVRSRAGRFRNLRDLMTRDSMTELYNHASFLQLLEKDLFRATRASAPVTFAMVDVDHFKRVNDTYGHGIGDIVLKTLARIMRHRLRNGDIIGRLGGEEFGVVLPNTSCEQALPVLDNLRLAFAEVSTSIEGVKAPITLSCGIAGSSEFNSVKLLLEAADQALYEAKDGGRNRVVRYHHQP